MKVLFISGGSLGEVSPIIKSQGDSLEKLGVSVDYFLMGRGFVGYIGMIPKLWKLKKDYDIFHAHYGLSAVIATFSGIRPIVCSIMGSDIYSSRVLRTIIRICSRYLWRITIVKSEKLKTHSNIINAHVIPNGVDLELFRPIPQTDARRMCGYNQDNKIVLFISDPQREEKNYKLAEEAIKTINSRILQLKTIHGVPHYEIPFFLNAADLLLVTSLWEGSVNVVKEALACNCKVVSTNVGDVENNIKGIQGCYICDFNPEDVAEKITMALSYKNKINGRTRISELGLNSEVVAKRILEIYQSYC